MSTFYCGGVGVQKYFLHAQMSTPCVECAITEIYLLLVARNLLYFKRFLATNNTFCSFLFFLYFLGFETYRHSGRQLEPGGFYRSWLYEQHNECLIRNSIVVKKDLLYR